MRVSRNFDLTEIIQALQDGTWDRTCYKTYSERAGIGKSSLYAYVDRLRQGEEIVTADDKVWSLHLSPQTSQAALPPPPGTFFPEEPRRPQESYEAELAELRAKLEALERRTYIPEPLDFNIPESPVALFKVPTFYGDFALISDIHIPYYSREVLEAYVQQAHRMGIKEAIWVGDTMDGNQFHPKRGGVQHKRVYQDDITLQQSIVTQMLNYFDTIHVLGGNHDGWFGAHMRGQIDPTFLMSKLYGDWGGRVTWTETEQADVISHNGVRIKVAHGANYSGSNALGNTKRMAAKFGCPVVTAHQHHHEKGIDVSGKFICIAMGGGCDSRRMEYVNKSPRTNPAQTNGFAMFKDGELTDYPIILH